MRHDPSQTLIRRANVSPSTLDVEKRTAEVIFSTGAKVRRNDLFGSFDEELSMDPAHVRLGRLQSGNAPFQLDHSGSVDSTVGVIEGARISNGLGLATVRFGKDARSDEIFQKVRDGLVRNVSVGYRIHKFEEVKGSDPKIPLMRATDWEPMEISAVAMGADPAAKFRSSTNRGSMDPQNEEQKTTVDLGADERARVSTIHADVRMAKLGDEIATRLVNSGLSVSEARAQIFEAMRQRNQASPVKENGGIIATVTDDGADRWARGAEAWIFERMGRNSAVHKAIAAKVPGFENIELDPGEFRGLSLFELARASIERRGIRTQGWSKTRIVGEALTYRSSGMATASDFPVLLENSLNKVLLGQYATTPDTWSRFCKVDSVVDFRANPRYRLGSFGNLDSLNEHGEFKNKAIPDGEKYVISATTKGNIIGISRQAIINDDMGAFSSAATQLGRAARLSIELDVYAALAQNGGLGPTQSDSQPFFYSGRGNVNGTGSALTVAGLDADRVVLAAQKDPSGNEVLDLKPSVLLVPSALGGDARVINGSLYDPTTGAATLQRPNKCYGLFQEVVDTARLTGTRRYVFADSSVAPAIIVAFLEGQGQAPYMEQQLGWRVDGTEWKVRLDYGVCFADFRGAVTNAGA